MELQCVVYLTGFVILLMCRHHVLPTRGGTIDRFLDLTPNDLFLMMEKLKTLNRVGVKGACVASAVS